PSLRYVHVTSFPQTWKTNRRRPLGQMKRKSSNNGVPSEEIGVVDIKHSVGRVEMQNGEYESEGKAYEDE
ncbi:hypothetical protein Tco_1459816, partial [Tanacetum coccineum]